jgi:hypothetical protein
MGAHLRREDKSVAHGWAGIGTCRMSLRLRRGFVFVGLWRTCPCLAYLSAGLRLIPLGVAGVTEVGCQCIPRPDRVLGVNLAQYATVGAIDARHRGGDFTAVSRGRILAALVRSNTRVSWWWALHFHDSRRLATLTLVGQPPCVFTTAAVIVHKRTASDENAFLSYKADTSAVHAGSSKGHGF